MIKTICQKWNEETRLNTFLIMIDTDYWMIGFSKGDDFYRNCKMFVLCILCFRFRWSWEKRSDGE